MSELSHQLQEGLVLLNLRTDPSYVTALLDYISLLVKWNKTYNLTAIREPENMLTHHLLDSLSVVSHLSGKSVIDIGSGAGLPGIPIALSRPDMAVTMLDSNQKKTTFIRQACIHLELKNTTVTSERAETWKPEAKYETVISRAFSSLSQFVKVARHLCDTGGVMLAMKGGYPHEELGNLANDTVVEDVIPLIVPGLEAERHLVVIRVK